jgi:hypothetical protein
MAASPTVTIFNVNPLSVQVSVNNGPQFSISGASAPNWTPQSPSQGGPTWSNTTPGQNVLAPGANYLNLTSSGGFEPMVANANLPRNIQWNSLQLYLFFNSYNELSWVVLNDGQFVTGNLQLSSAAVR